MSKVYFFLKDIDTSKVAGEDKREAWMPKGGIGYFDKSARQYFDTKNQKRAWLRAGGMREAGELYQPNKWHGEGRMTKQGGRNA